MISTTVIKLIKPNDEKLSSQFKELLRFISQIPPEIDNAKIIFDLSNMNFIFPLLVTCLTALKKNLESKRAVVEVIGIDASVSSYLSTIKFLSPFDSLTTSGGESSLKVYEHKSYLPITLIHTGEVNSRIRESVQTVFSQITRKQLGLNTSLYSAFSYILGEFIDNIDQHSLAPFGYIMVQHYPKLGFMQLCIVDTGSGILQSYLRNDIHNITTNAEAINQALNGKTTKKDDIDRGFGISTSRKMLVKGLGGEFFLMSGNALFIYTKEYEQIVNLDVKQDWNGTILALTIPTFASADFDYLTYVE